MVQNIDYFYDSQIRTIILHVGRLFMGWQISTGKDADGNDILRRVPCRFVSYDRNVTSVIMQNSENFMMSAPFMTYAIENIDINREMTGPAWEKNDELLTDRHFDAETGTYTAERGNSYHVQRMHPTPVTLNFKVYVWTTKLDHKFQLLEQIMTPFNPAIQLQTSMGLMDWTATPELLMTGLNWTSRSMPVGTEDGLDIMELDFELKTYINPPADVRKQTVIHTILYNIGEGSCLEDIYGWNFDDIHRSVHTPGDHFIKVVNTNRIILLDAFGKTTTTTWKELLDKYGKYEPGVTRIRVRALVDDIEDTSQDVIGTITIDEFDPTVVHWDVDIDTLPQTTMAPANAIINPHEVFPGSVLPTAAKFQRYILLDELANTTDAWGIIKDPLGANVAAGIYDVIEYDGVNWIVQFDASAYTPAPMNPIIASLETGNRYEFMDKDAGWVDPINGIWRQGWWRIIINLFN